MRINPLPAIRVTPVPEQKFFEDADFRELEERVQKVQEEVKAAPDAMRALPFNQLWVTTIRAAIKETSRMIALRAGKHLAERDARISALMTAVEARDRQIERHAQHLQRLENRIQFLERHTQAKP